MISRLELRLSDLESWYGDWNQDYQIFSLDIETEIKTLSITVSISRLVSRLKNFNGSLWSRLSQESPLTPELHGYWPVLNCQPDLITKIRIARHWKCVAKGQVSECIYRKAANRGSKLSYFSLSLFCPACATTLLKMQNRLKGF